MKKPLWDVEESIGFETMLAPDGVYYKVHSTNPNKKRYASELAKIRKDINTLLVYLMKNPGLWMDKKMEPGIIHTFDIHIPGWNNYMDRLLQSKDPNAFIIANSRPLFSIQEMTPNDHGIIGLNKPRDLYFKGGTKWAGRRTFHLAQRKSYNDLLALAIHELTHTTCNDCEWKDDNHMHPYGSYHSFMRRCAKEIGILQ
jgi:hypothetical protein